MKFYPILLILCFLTPIDSSLAEEKPVANENVPLFAEILEYALLSESAYEVRDSVARLAKDMDVELTLYEHVPGLDVTYFLLTDSKNKSQWIAVRGTVNVKNTLVNLDLQLLPNKDIGIQLHSGFAETAKDIFLKIKPWLKKEYITRVTGHSLGGAVATVVAMYLDINNYSVERVITFGQPKVTNFSGAQKFSHLNLLRVVTAKDFVPLLPPADMVDLNIMDLNSVGNVGIFWPLGQEIILLENNEYSMANGLDSILRATKFLNKQPDMKNLQPHRIEFYLQEIKGRQQKAKWIPYKNDFSIFSIFGNGQ